ncbi:MAG: pyridoxamine 5'-phosphate oxidase family protein [Thermoleophilaceae bacterium]
MLWPDPVDEVLAGDMTAALAYLTPAGGAVVTAVAPVGLRDREQGTVIFTTSLGFGKKLERIERDPRVGLAYHARDHGFASGDSFVLVQGRCRPVPAADSDWNTRVLGPASERFMGPPRRGRFWDRWLREYYADRVAVTVDVERVTVWPSQDCSGEPVVHGTVRPDEQPEPQRVPGKGAGPRLDAVKAAGKLARMPHVLVSWRDTDGFPIVAAARVEGAGADGIRLVSGAGLPRGGRRAGVLGHSYGPKLVGLQARQHTGWLQDGVYAPHTASAFRAPGNKTLLLLANGLLAKQGLRKARREGRAAA